MKNKGIAYLLWFFLGVFGIHRMYCGKWLTGLLWLFTLGLCGIGWFVDLFLTSNMVDYANAIYLGKTKGYNDQPSVNVQIINQ